MKAVGRALDETYLRQRPANSPIQVQNKTTPKASAKTGTRTKSIWRLIVGGLLVVGSYNSFLAIPQDPMRYDSVYLAWRLGFTILGTAIGVWLVVSYLITGRNRSEQKRPDSGTEQYRTSQRQFAFGKRRSMASRFFLATLTRRQYLIRFLIVFVVVVAALLFFVGAPTNLVRIAGILLQIVVLLAFLYNIVGLSLPRLKSAQISPLMVVLVFIPLLGALALFAICAIAREKA